MARPSISEDTVPLAAEDKFLIMSIREAKGLCPGLDDAAALRDAIELAQPFLGHVIPLFDLRGLAAFYRDVELFIDEVAGAGAHILINSSTAANLDIDAMKQRLGNQVLIANGQSYSAKPFHLSDLRGHRDQSGSPSIDKDPFLSVAHDLMMHFINERDGDVLDADYEIDYSLPSLSEFQRVLTEPVVRAAIAAWTKRESRFFCGVSPKDMANSFRLFLPKLHASLSGEEELYGMSAEVDSAAYYLRSAFVHSFLKRMHRHSLLIEFVMTVAGDEITCAPYHAKGLHYVESPTNSSVLLGRPAILAEKTNAIFSDEIVCFEALLNSSTTRERHIQRFLEEHPSFLKGLNYSNIYPQLVLERDDRSTLIPDFVLEPIDDEWCDILDIKLPTQPIIVGRNDRQTLAAGIHEVASQLREYAAYFEQDRYRKWVQERFGLRVYRPRLIALVGRDMKAMAEAEIRRAMTAYDQLQIMTFDQLINHAKSRLLI